MYKVGLIGMGQIGQRYIDIILKSGHQLAGVAGSSSHSSNIYADLYDTMPFQSWKDLVESESIDLVINNTPNTLHFEVNKHCLEIGKPVYSEKPLGRNTKETGEMVQLAENGGIANVVNFNRRGFPAIALIKSMIEHGELGHILLVRGNYLQDWLLYPQTWNWRVDPEMGEESRAFSDIGAHLLDISLYLTGLKPKSVFYERQTLIPERKKPGADWVKIENEDYGTLLVRFQSGAQGVFTVCQTAAGHAGSDLWLEIAGSKKGLLWREREANVIRVKRYMDEDEYIHAEESKYNSHGQFEVYQDFIKWIEGNKRDTVPTFRDGHRMVHLTELAMKSFKAGKWVDCDQSCV